MSSIEYILRPNPNRFSLLPVVHKDLYELFEIAEGSLWTTKEVDLSRDYSDWLKLDLDTKKYLSYTLAFFNVSDGIVNENLAKNFSNEVQIPEARAFYGIQIGIETIHSKMYSLLLDQYIKDAKEKQFYFNALDTIPSIKKKAQWTLRWITGENGVLNPFPERLVAFACVELIFFSGSFCSIFWMKKLGKLPGLCQANDLISRDEGLHGEFACLLYRKYIQHKLPESRILEIVIEATNHEIEFVCESLEVEIIGINKHLMTQYIKYCADRVLLQLDCSPYYKVDNPFDWMELMSVVRKTDFFVGKVSDYQKATLSCSYQLVKDF